MSPSYSFLEVMQKVVGDSGAPLLVMVKEAPQGALCPGIREGYGFDFRVATRCTVVVGYG